jgi:hypothetical protein
MFYKVLLLWLAIIPLAIGNGIVRERLLNPRMPHSLARALSGVFLMLLILGFSLLTVPWLGWQQGYRWIDMGVLWCGWTLLFEFGFGRFVARKTWAELLKAYTFKGGELWPLVLVMVFFAPWFAAGLRGLR